MLNEFDYTDVYFMLSMLFYSLDSVIIIKLYMIKININV